MPTYEYACTACDNHWEEVQKISEAALEVCPKCGKSTAKRQISGGSFILKGGGWYADLYSSSGAKKGAEKAEKGGEANGEAKKPDTKPPPAPAATTPASSASSSSSEKK
jgi:putative FmdB family regulatory protein